MEALRILFISPYLPSLIRVRPYNLIQYLARHGHQITLLALVPPNEDESGLNELRQWCHKVKTVPLPRWRTYWNALKAVPSQTPLQAAYSRSPQMATLIQQTQAQTDFDVAHVEHMRGSELSPAVQDIPIVFDSVDSISLLFDRVSQSGPTLKSRLLAKFEGTRNRRYEGQLLEHYSQVLATSPHDQEALIELSTVPEAKDRMVVLPNGVDLDYFTPMNTPRDARTLIFTGKMSYHANIAAADTLITEIMPLVWQQMPDAKVLVVGKDPPDHLLALAEDPRITVTGFVTDIRPYLAQSTVSVLPMRYGVGIQNKALEAMAMVTPVISTPQSVSALQTQIGQDVMVAETPQAMAETVITMLNDETLRTSIGEAGRRYVESYHDWNKVADRLETIYREAIIEAKQKRQLYK
jgi:sugar transferase (PEP-CTERM/EpsH1 system associated)